MVLITPVLLLLLSWVSMHNTVHAAAENCRGTHCSGSETGDARPCTGAHCPGGRSSRPPRQSTGQGRGVQIVGSHYHAYPGSPRAAASEGTRMRAPEVLPAGCTDAGCAAIVKQFQPTSNDTRDCKGIECRLPLRIRPKARAKSCVGEGCLAASEESASSTSSQLPPVHLFDRAAQFLGDFPEFGYPSSELGGAPLGVQLTCDIKPGNCHINLSVIVIHAQLRIITTVMYLWLRRSPKRKVD